MWMLRTGSGMVETVCKIITFFPSKLPQYQDQCVSVPHWRPFCMSLHLRLAEGERPEGSLISYTHSRHGVVNSKM